MATSSCRRVSGRQCVIAAVRRGRVDRFNTLALVKRPLSRQWPAQRAHSEQCAIIDTMRDAITRGPAGSAGNGRRRECESRSDTEQEALAAQTSRRLLRTRATRVHCVTQVRRRRCTATRQPPRVIAAAFSLDFRRPCQPPQPPRTAPKATLAAPLTSRRPSAAGTRPGRGQRTTGG